MGESGHVRVGRPGKLAEQTDVWAGSPRCGGEAVGMRLGEWEKPSEGCLKEGQLLKGCSRKGEVPRDEY